MRKGRNYRQIAQALPQLADNDDVIMTADTLDTLQDVASFTESEGGKILIKECSKRAVDILYNLIATYKREHTHMELVTHLSRLESELILMLRMREAPESAENQQKLLDEILEEVS